MTKWEELKNLINADIGWPVHYSHSREYEHNQMRKVLEWMEYLEEKEAKDIKEHAQIMAVKEDKKEEGFLFTGVPTFDQKEWDKMLKNLEGLS